MKNQKGTKVYNSPTYRCFHCGQSFMDQDAAADHFGKRDEREHPVCPGKPKRKPQFEHGQQFLIWNPEGYAVGEIYGPSNEEKIEEFMSNARLIAAAPDLLAALEMAVACLKDHNLDELMAGEFEILEDAIAKAI